MANSESFFTCITSDMVIKDLNESTAAAERTIDKIAALMIEDNSILT